MKRNRIKEDEPTLKGFNPRSPDAIAVPTGRHIETLPIRPRQEPKSSRLGLDKIGNQNTTG